MSVVILTLVCRRTPSNKSRVDTECCCCVTDADTRVDVVGRQNYVKITTKNVGSQNDDGHCRAVWRALITGDGAGSGHCMCDVLRRCWVRESYQLQWIVAAPIIATLAVRLRRLHTRATAL